MSEEFFNLHNYQDTTAIPKIKLEQTVTKISINNFDSIAEQSRMREREYHRMLARQKEIQNQQLKEKAVKKVVFDTNEIPYLKTTNIKKETPLIGIDDKQFMLNNYDVRANSSGANVYKTVGEIDSAVLRKEEQKIETRFKPSWFLGVFILMFFLLAWIRLRFKKQFDKILGSIFSYQAAANIYRNKSLLSQRVSYQMNLLFILTAGLFLNQLFHYYGIILHQKEIYHIIIAFSIPLIFIVYKYILSLLVGFFSYKSKLFDEYYFNTAIFLKLAGLIAFPLVIIIPYLNTVSPELLFNVSFVFFGIVLILWILRTFQIFIRKGVSIFFLILYLCALEILPVMIAVKFISV